MTCIVCLCEEYLGYKYEYECWYACSYLFTDFSHTVCSTFVFDAYMHVSVYTHIYAYMYEHVCAGFYRYIYIYIYIYICMSACAYINTYPYTQIRKYMYNIYICTF